MMPDRTGFEVLEELKCDRATCQIPAIVMTTNFKGGTRHVIYPWNQSQIENRKSSSPRIYPWGQSKI